MITRDPTLRLSNLIILPDGMVFDPVSLLCRFKEKLAWEQRKLSRKKLFSRNWYKQKHRIDRLHERIANIRYDRLQKLTTWLCKKHTVIVVEDLKIRSMTRSARGTVGKPGRNVRAKLGFNKSILDQGWGILVKVDPRDTSRTCPRPGCGHVAKENRVSRDRFRCVTCGFATHADQADAFPRRGATAGRRAGHGEGFSWVVKVLLAGHSPDRPFAKSFGEPGLSPVVGA